MFLVDRLVFGSLLGFLLRVVLLGGFVANNFGELVDLGGLLAALFGLCGCWFLLCL